MSLALWVCGTLFAAVVSWAVGELLTGLKWSHDHGRPYRRASG
jgi:hypothetical protein